MLLLDQDIAPLVNGTQKFLTIGCEKTVTLQIIKHEDKIYSSFVKIDPIFYQFVEDENKKEIHCMITSNNGFLPHVATIQADTCIPTELLNQLADIRKEFFEGCETTTTNLQDSMFSYQDWSWNGNYVYFDVLKCTGEIWETKVDWMETNQDKRIIKLKHEDKSIYFTVDGDRVQVWKKDWGWISSLLKKLHDVKVPTKPCFTVTRIPDTKYFTIQLSSAFGMWLHNKCPFIPLPNQVITNDFLMDMEYLANLYRNGKEYRSTSVITSKITPWLE